MSVHADAVVARQGRRPFFDQDLPQVRGDGGKGCRVQRDGSVGRRAGPPVSGARTVGARIAVAEEFDTPDAEETG